VAELRVQSATLQAQPVTKKDSLLMLTSWTDRTLFPNTI
jgi:hypothetical protein